MGLATLTSLRRGHVAIQCLSKGAWGMWVTLAVVALLLLCIGLSYALRQVTQVERRVCTLLQTQATRVGELQTAIDALNEAHAVPLAEVVPLQLNPKRRGDPRI